MLSAINSFARQWNSDSIARQWKHFSKTQALKFWLNFEIENNNRPFIDSKTKRERSTPESESSNKLQACWISSHDKPRACRMWLYGIRSPFFFIPLSVARKTGSTCSILSWFRSRLRPYLFNTIDCSREVCPPHKSNTIKYMQDCARVRDFSQSIWLLCETHVWLEQIDPSQLFNQKFLYSGPQ